MTSTRLFVSTAATGLLACVALGSVPARCGDLGAASSVRCRDFGVGFIDLGNGVCERMGGHIGGQVRVQLGHRDLGQSGWGSAATTSHAAMRGYDGDEATDAAPATTEHLRVGGSSGVMLPYR